MTKIKIAVPTNDRKTLAERSGRAKEFAVISLDNKQIVDVGYRENKHEHNHDHSHGEHAHGHQDIVDALHDCVAVVGRKFGPHFAGDFHKAGIKLILSKKESIEAAAMEALGRMG